MVAVCWALSVCVHFRNENLSSFIVCIHFPISKYQKLYIYEMHVHHLRLYQNYRDVQSFTIYRSRVSKQNSIHFNFSRIVYEIKSTCRWCCCWTYIYAMSVMLFYRMTNMPLKNKCTSKYVYTHTEHSHLLFHYCANCEKVRTLSKKLNII